MPNLTKIETQVVRDATSGNPWRQLPLPLRRRVKAATMSEGLCIHQWLERACNAALEAKR